MPLSCLQNVSSVMYECVAETPLCTSVLLCSLLALTTCHLLAFTSSLPLLLLPWPYLFSISAPSAGQIIVSPRLARPLSARHTIFGIGPFCQAASQWHQLSPLPLQHPPLSAPQSWSIYPPSDWSFSQTTRAKRKEEMQRCQPASQATSQPACQPAQLPSFLQSAVKPICWKQH